MLNDLLFALWFFLPAGLANAAPVFASRIPLLNRLGIPIDGGRHFRGRRLFGDHKTLRGFIAGVFVAISCALLQQFIYTQSSWVQSFSLIDYRGYAWSVVLGLLLGFGALAGDAIKSFFKRQLNVASGKSWFPFDQIDYIAGGLLSSSVLINLPHSSYLIIGIVWFLVHPTATFIAWLTGLKDSPI